MRLPVDRAAFPKLLLCGVASLVLYILHPIMAVIPTVFALLVLGFLRDPHRSVQEAGAGDVLAPADGRITSIRYVDRSPVLDEPALVITTFLSLTDVHINRIPITGVVEQIRYHPGKYLVAFADKASEVNERNYVVIRGTNLRIVVAQIAGFVARRIICRVEQGQQVSAGDRFGLIQFGSAAQVFLPPDADVSVRPGDHVQGGTTVLARCRQVSVQVPTNIVSDEVAAASKAGAPVLPGGQDRGA